MVEATSVVPSPVTAMGGSSTPKYPMAPSQTHVQLLPASELESMPNVERATMVDALPGEMTTCPARG